MGETRRDRLFGSELGFDVLDFDGFAVDADASLLRLLRTVVPVELEGLVVAFDFGRPTGRGGENAGLALFVGAIPGFATQIYVARRRTLKSSRCLFLDSTFGVCTCTQHEIATSFENSKTRFDVFALKLIMHTILQTFWRLWHLTRDDLTYQDSGLLLHSPSI